MEISIYLLCIYIAGGAREGGLAERRSGGAGELSGHEAVTSAGGCDGGGPAGPPVAVACPCEAGAECDWSGWAGCCRERRRPGRCMAGGRGGTGGTEGWSAAAALSYASPRRICPWAVGLVQAARMAGRAPSGTANRLCLGSAQWRQPLLLPRHFPMRVMRQQGKQWGPLRVKG